MTIYVVWREVDPGYSAAHLLGAFSTRTAAEKRIADIGIDYDVGVIELVVDEPADEELSA